MKMKADLTKFSGYANLYQQKVTTPWGTEFNEYHIGGVAKEIKDLPLYHEYDVAPYKHLGIIKISTELIMDHEQTVNIAKTLKELNK